MHCDRALQGNLGLRYFDICLSISISPPLACDLHEKLTCDEANTKEPEEVLADEAVLWIRVRRERNQCILDGVCTESDVDTMMGENTTFTKSQDELRPARIVSKPNSLASTIHIH